MTDVSVLGDLHGHYDQYLKLLSSHRLIDEHGNWSGGDRHLWLIGDLFDRGLLGLKCLELTMKLQQQAVRSGGRVQSLLGNHELMILCAYKFPDYLTSAGIRIMDQWLMWGGTPSDLENFTDEHADWISELPAMAKVGDRLLIHADAILYVDYGRSIDEVNRALRAVMRSSDLSPWEAALNGFSEHKTFSGLSITGGQRAQLLLKLYGGKQIIHGHTPITFATGLPADQVTEAWLYADDRCINVDGGIYLGGSGFIYRFSSGEG